MYKTKAILGFHLLFLFRILKLTNIEKDNIIVNPNKAKINRHKAVLSYDKKVRINTKVVNVLIKKSGRNKPKFFFIFKITIFLLKPEKTPLYFPTNSYVRLGK